MNIINVDDIERELRRYAARLIHAHCKRWVNTVARNYVLGKLPEKDVDANFYEITVHNDVPSICVYGKHRPVPKVPAWALPILAHGEPLVWFDNIQPGRRELWSALDLIVMWFNSWKAEDTRLRRVDRIGFPVATNAAALWYKDVSENIWHYVTDRPVVKATYEHGFRWVQLVTALQFEREGRLMHHCVGNGSYYNNWRLSNSREYFSLRDRHNNPHATLEVVFDSGNPLRKGSVSQCKGNSNMRPGREFQPYIRRFIADMKWQRNGDIENIDWQ